MNSEQYNLISTFLNQNRFYSTINTVTAGFNTTTAAVIALFPYELKHKNNIHTSSVMFIFDRSFKTFCTNLPDATIYQSKVFKFCAEYKRFCIRTYEVQIERHKTSHQLSPSTKIVCPSLRVSSDFHHLI